MGFLNNTDPREKAVNQQIQQTHNQINELYLDLGRYVKLNLKDKIDDQYVRNAAQNIDDCLARLQQLNNDLNSIRGIKLCCNCNAQIPMAVTFCPSCGTKQPDMQMNGMGMGGAPMNGGFGAPMNNGMGAPMNNGMNNGMGAPMNNGMNNAMGAPMNNTMNAPANNGGFGGAAPIPTPVPTPSPAQFNPTSAGNSPANANKNKIGANTQQPPIPAAPVPPVTDNIPPVPAAPQQNDMLKDIPPVPPMPNAEQNTAAPSEIPPVPPMPEMTDRKPDEADTQAGAPAPVIEDKPTAAPAPAAPAANESFVFCSQCGHKEPASVAFCSQCGSKL